MDPNPSRWSNGFRRALAREATPNALAPAPIPSPADLLTPNEADLLVFPIVTGTLRLPKVVAR